MEVKTPFDDTQATINGVSLRDAYLMGKQVGVRDAMSQMYPQPLKASELAIAIGEFITQKYGQAHTADYDWDIANFVLSWISEKWGIE